MFSKKQWSVFISLVLISQKDYKWHGYQIKKYIGEVYHEDNENVFPVLRELTKEGFIDYKQIIDENNRARKHYKITLKGQKVLDDFQQHNNKVEHLLNLRGGKKNATMN